MSLSFFFLPERLKISISNYLQIDYIWYSPPTKPISGKKNFHALNKDKNNTKNVINTQYKQRKNAEADKNKIIR